MASDFAQNVFNKATAAAWHLLQVVAMTVGVTVGVLHFGYQMASKAAADIVAPVDEKISTHLAAVTESRARMEMFAQRIEDQNKRQNEKLDALCRALPRAKCPLGF